MKGEIRTRKMTARQYNCQQKTIQWLKEYGQTMIYKTLHRAPRIKQYEPHRKPEVNPDAPKVQAVPAALDVSYITALHILYSVLNADEHREKAQRDN